MPAGRVRLGSLLPIIRETCMIARSPMSEAQPPTADDAHFCLYWTVGFSGKRFIADETKAAEAIRHALEFLQSEAQRHDAKLSAVSSVARGGDVLFARCCEEAREASEAKPRPQTLERIPWKCLLPFQWEEFIERDLRAERRADGTEVPLSTAERALRKKAADRCIAAAYAIPPPAQLDTNDPAMIRSAYVECGYRAVDEADVMILLLNRSEFEEVLAQAEFCRLQDVATSGTEMRMQPAGCIGEHVSVRSYGPGTKAVARYSIASRRPTILLNVDAADPWNERKIVHPPEKALWFVDPVVTSVVRQAKKQKLLDYDDEEPPGKMTPGRRAARLMGKHLGGLANSHQTTVKKGLGRMLKFHLLATALAALGATVIALTGEQVHSFYESFSWAWLLLIFFLFLSALKPALAYWAKHIEHKLHSEHNRTHWLHARVLAEAARAAVAMWPLPQQPLDAADEEDFPKLKRLLRTLRVMRELEGSAAVDKATPLRIGEGESASEGETQIEADMRLACTYYVKARLHDQAEGYYGKQKNRHIACEKRWRRVFKIAIWSAIVSGTIYFGYKFSHYPAWHHSKATAEAEKSPDPAKPAHKEGEEEPWRDLPWLNLAPYLAFVAIVAPSVASYALAMKTILDCQRRAERFGEMQHFLNRLSDTLLGCAANPSRLRLIEQAERMMIEEQHEWFSVTRNFNV
jgi:hypothetical protein